MMDGIFQEWIPSLVLYFHHGFFSCTFCHTAAYSNILLFLVFFKSIFFLDNNVSMFLYQLTILCLIVGGEGLR